MNKLILKTVMVLALTGFCGVAAQAQTRLATVDVKKVVDNYWKTKEAMAALKDRREDLLKEFKGLSDQVKQSEEDYKKLMDDANDPAISVEEREKRKQSAETKFKAINELKDRAREFDRNASATLNEQAQRMADRVDEKIRATVVARAKAAGYGLVIDISAKGLNNKAVVLYANDDNDMTSAVLEQLNSDAPPETSKSGEKSEKK